MKSYLTQAIVMMSNTDNPLVSLALAQCRSVEEIQHVLERYKQAGVPCMPR